VGGDGLYGLTLIGHAAGAAYRPPQPGAAPQLWAEVDTTRPDVRVLGVGSVGGRLTIHWRAIDTDLGPRPITLSYGPTEGGPWSPIAAGVEDTGRYVWQAPPGAPRRLAVRVEATDRAGNVGAAQTLVDLGPGG
jgi:hypothetical protein